MTDADLDHCYTALSHALAQVGEERSALLLSMLSLAFIARSSSAQEVLPLLEQVRVRCVQEPPT